MGCSVLVQRLAIANEALRQALAGLDPDDLTPQEAGVLFEEFDRATRAAATGCTLLARRVEDGMEWKRKGYRNAAEHLAATTGSSFSTAKRKLATSKALKDLPSTRAAMAQGRLSPEQGETIADAAAANPGAERALIGKAARSNLQELRDEAQRAKAAADPSPEERHRRLHRARRVTRFTDPEGARHLNICGPVDEVAVIEAEIDRRVTVEVRTRPAGVPLESRDAMAFDATVDMARRSQRADDTPTGHETAETGQTDETNSTGRSLRARSRQPRPEHLALLRLDVEALWRGHVEGDELCEITGLGPIPVTVARRLLGDAVLKLIITKGNAVAHVTSLTRGPTQAMRYALLWSSPTCIVEGCTRTIVEHDHTWGAEYKHTRHTRLDELDRACHTHHDLHTYHGWALVPGTGKRPMVPPDHPHHPANAPPPAAAGAAPPTASAGPAPPTSAPPPGAAPPTSAPPPGAARRTSTARLDPATRTEMADLVERARAAHERARPRSLHDTPTGQGDLFGTTAG